MYRPNSSDSSELTKATVTAMIRTLCQTLPSTPSAMSPAAAPMPKVKAAISMVTLTARRVSTYVFPRSSS